MLDFAEIFSFNPHASNSALIMSGATLSNGTRAASTTLTASKDSSALANQASSAWRNFEDAVKNISEHSSVFSKITEAMDQHNALEVEGQKKDKRIADLELGFQVQMDEHEKRYNKWKEEKSQFEQRAVATKAELTAQTQGMLKKQRITSTQDMEKLKKELEAEKKTLATLRLELEKANAKTHKVDKELRHCTEQLSEWKGYLSSLKDIDFKALYADCINYVVHGLIFCPQRCQSDAAFHPLLQNCPYLFPPRSSRKVLYCTSLTSYVHCTS